MDKIVVGCDPGATGAIAVLVNGELKTLMDMPTVKRKIGRSNRSLINEHILAAKLDKLRETLPTGKVTFVLEEVGPAPRDGCVQAFSFGYSYGVLRGAVSAYRWPLELVRPAEWKRKMGLAGQPKDASRDLAAKRYPGSAGHFSRAKDDGRAEAVLIALYWWKHGK